VYQLRVVLRGISPLIRRRLRVRSDSTLADLHATTLQIALGRSAEHLNRFVIHGRKHRRHRRRHPLGHCRDRAWPCQAQLEQLEPSFEQGRKTVGSVSSGRTDSLSNSAWQR
jgi:hypothetical protein